MCEKNYCSASVVPWVVAFSLSALSLVGATSREVPLVEAVKDGKVEAVRALVAARNDVNATELDGSTALHWAVHKDDVATVDLLLRAGANVTVVNRYGISPLFLAAENGNAAIIERLLGAGADPTTKVTAGGTVLMTAARAGNADAVRVLIAHGANVNAREETRQQTALMWAAARGNVETIKALIAAGADLRATSTEHKEVFENTFLAGRRIPASGAPIRLFTPLLFAVRAGHIDAVRMLLDNGANPNDSVPDGTTALHIACLNAQWEVGAVLLDKGADPNAAGNGYTPLHALVRTRTAKIIFRGGGLPAPVGRGAMTSNELAKKLIGHGADVHARVTKLLPVLAPGEVTSVIGGTPLMLAANPPDPEMARLLLAHGADPNLAAADNTTPLNSASGAHYTHPIGAHEEALEFAKVMIEVGADVNAANEKGETPLHHAAGRGYNPLVQFLVDQGAKLDAKTKNGRTPLMMANLDSRSGALYEYPETVALLRKLYEERGLPVVVPSREEAIARLTRRVRLKVTCPDSQTVKSNNGRPTPVTYPPAAVFTGSIKVFPGDPTTMVTCTPPSGSEFPIGATTVSCEATHYVSGETESCTVLMRVLP